MWQSKDEFLAALDPVKDEYDKMRQDPHTSWLPEMSNSLIDKRWGLYQNAKASNLGLMVMGRTVLGKDDAGRIAMKDAGVNAIEEVDLANFGATTEGNVNLHTELRETWEKRGVQVKRTGAILDIGVWHIFINDCWILGGVYAHLEFHLVTKRTKAAIYPPPAT